MGLRDALEDCSDRCRRAEEERARDAIDHDVGIVGRCLVVGWPAVFLVRPIFRNQRLVRLEGGRLRHAMNEQDRAKGKTDNDGFRQVAEDREQERYEEHGCIAPGSSQKRHERMPLEHPPGDDDEDRCKTRQRDERASGAAKIIKAKIKTECSIPAIGPCAPERTFVAVRAMVPVTQKPLNNPEAMLAYALSDQFAIGAMASAGHAVGDNCRKEGLDRSKQGEGGCARQHGLDFGGIELGKEGRGQARGNATKLAADRGDRQIEQPVASRRTPRQQ